MPNLDRMTADMRQFAEWGYRPIFFDISTMPANVSAAPSWENSLPRAIVASDPIIQAIKRGRRPSEANNDQAATGGSDPAPEQAQQRPAPRQPRAMTNRRGPAFVVRSAETQDQADESSSVSRPSAPPSSKSTVRNRPRR
jgi:hypothetical protein